MNCPICDVEVDGLLVGHTVTKIKEKGLATLTIRAAQKGLSYNVATGDLVHKECYRVVTHPRSFTQQDAASCREKQKRSGFDYRTCCLFCAKKIAKLIPNEKVKSLYA